MRVNIAKAWLINIWTGVPVKIISKLAKLHREKISKTRQTVQNFASSYFPVWAPIYMEANQI